MSDSWERVRSDLDQYVQFARRLGLFSATMVVISGIIGGGIFINPHLVAERVHTPFLILAVWIAGGALAGFYGLLVAIPTAACVKILLNEVFWPRFRAWSQGQAPDILPIRKD